jgi:succinoglycan biosynthesis protein ExoA
VPRLPDLTPDPATSVVVPARDAAGTLEATVAAILDQGDVIDEVVIAVGPSQDATRAVADALAATDDRIRVVDNPSGRTPAALNRAVAAARGEVIVRVDAHALLPAGYVRRAIDVLRDTGAGNVGGTQAPAAESGFARGVAAAMSSQFGAGGATYRTGKVGREAETVYLGVFRREALDAVGGFDERLVRNQDYELNHRLRDAGFRVWFDPELAVAYAPRRTPAALWRQYWQYGRWKRATLRLHPSSLRPRQLAAPLLVIALGAAVVASVVIGSWWPAVFVVGGYVAGIVVAAAAAARSAAVWPATVLALLVMHLSWGVAFLVGPPRGALEGRGPAQESGRARTR